MRDRVTGRLQARCGVDVKSSWVSTCVGALVALAALAVASLLPAVAQA